MAGTDCIDSEKYQFDGYWKESYNFKATEANFSEFHITTRAGCLYCSARSLYFPCSCSGFSSRSLRKIYLFSFLVSSTFPTHLANRSVQFVFVAVYVGTLHKYWLHVIRNGDDGPSSSDDDGRGSRTCRSNCSCI
jgi:hypothetical protein